MVTVPRPYQLGYYNESVSPWSVPGGIPVPRTPVELFLFLAPLLQFINLSVVGTLFATDVLLVAALPFVILGGIGRLSRRQIWIPLLLGVVWLFSQMATDVVRSSEPADYLRGWSKLFLTITHLATLWILIRGSLRRYFLYGFGWALGTIAMVLINPNEVAKDQPWKFALATPVTFLVLILATLLVKGTRRWIIPLIMVSMGLVHLFSSLRSLGLICMAAAAYSYFLMKTYTNGKRPGMAKMVGLGLVMALAVFGFVRFYEYAAESGLLNEKDQQKYTEQSSGSGGLLLGGRSESLATVQAVIDSPILGHGSWARDAKYHNLLEQKLLESGKKVTYNPFGDLIPTHSFLMGAWVEAGAAGAIFWIYIFCQIFQTLRRASGGEPFLAVFAFIGMAMMWDILFSPYGAERRFVATYVFIGMIMFGDLTDNLRARRLRGSI